MIPSSEVTKSERGDNHGQMHGYIAKSRLETVAKAFRMKSQDAVDS